MPVFDPAKAMATRKASGEVINAIAEVMPEFWGGSADLAESNPTTIEGGGSFLPADSRHPPRRPTDASCTSASASMRWARSSTASRSGLDQTVRRNLPGVSDYMRGAVRIAALMQAPVTYVWTHDSIGLGRTVRPTSPSNTSLR